MSPRNFYLPRTRYIDGPGGSMTVSVTREAEITAFLETENEKGKDFSKTIDTKTVVDHLRYWAAAPGRASHGLLRP